MPKKRYTAAFKSKVVLEAIKGQKTISEITSEFEVHPNQVSQWKRQLRAGLEDLSRLIGMYPDGSGCIH